MIFSAMFENRLNFFFEFLCLKNFFSFFLRQFFKYLKFRAKIGWNISWMSHLNFHFLNSIFLFQKSFEFLRQNCDIQGFCFFFFKSWMFVYILAKQCIPSIWRFFLESVDFQFQNRKWIHCDLKSWKLFQVRN